MKRLKWRQRVALRLLGVKISRDGRRWTAPRKREAMVADAFERVVADAWREDKAAAVERRPDGLALTGPAGRIELKWRG